METAMSLEDSLQKVKNLRSSKIVSQQKQVALLDGIESMLKDDGQIINATSYYATLLSLLDREDAAESATEILAYVVPFVPKGLLASKLDVVIAKLLPVLLNNAGTAVTRASIAVLESILVCVDANAWRVPLSELGAQRTLSGVLTLAQDSRPKIRKRALEAVGKILQEGKGGHMLSFDAVIASTEAAAQAKVQQKLLHSLQLLNVVLSSVGELTASQIESVISLLLQLVRGSDQFTTLSVFAALETLPADDVRVTKALIDLAPSVNDKQVAPPWLAGLAQRQPPLLDVIQHVTPYLMSEHAEVIESCGQCLIALISESFDNSSLTAVERLASEYLFPLLQVKYHNAWATVCEVCAAFIATLPYELAPKSEGVINIVRVVGALRTTANEADQVIGAAISVLGPSIICELLPLQLDPHTGSGRAWLLPLFAQHVAHTKLGFYFDQLVPLANEFEEVAKALPESRRSKILHTIAEQLLTLFPNFCTECQDHMNIDQLKEVLGWLYARPHLRPSVCLGLKQYVQTAEDSSFASKHGSDILKALMNVFQAMNVDSRGYILDTIDAYLAVLPAPEVSQLFNQVSEVLAKSLGDAEARHTLMDIIVALVPYLDAGNSQVVFNLFKTIASMNDALMQKKAYRILSQFKPGHEVSQLIPALLELQSSVTPNARRTRLQALQLVGDSIPDDGDFSFIFRTLPEAILGTKDPNEKTREAAFNLLVAYGRRMLTCTGGVVDHSAIPELIDDDQKVAVNITEYFEMIMAGLAGSTPHMIAATATALARVLYEFHDSLDEAKVEEQIEIVWMLLESPSREIVTAVLGFVKVSVLIMRLEHLERHLPQLLSALLTWSNEHKNQFKGKVRHLIERLVRRCGYDMVEKSFPESEKKLLHNIQKSRERSKRKRAEHANSDANAPTRPSTEMVRQRKFDNEFDEALYGSDSESDDDASEDAQSKPRQVNQNKPKQGGNAKARSEQFIINGSDPLDLLDERALTKISNSDPRTSKMSRKVRHDLPQTKDGKLVIGRNVEAEKEKATADALAAYMDAVREGPVRTQSGKLKYRRGKKAHQKEEADDDDEPTKPQLKGSRVGKTTNLKKHMQKRRKL